MRIPAKIIRAAIECQAKGDVRFYLNGFNVTKKQVQATNGHVAITMDHGIKRARTGIYSIKSRIPAKCETVEFVLKKDLKIVKFLDECYQVLSVAIVEVIDGKFPKINEKIIDELMKSPIDNTSIPRINTSYLALPDRIFKKIPFAGIDLEFRGEDKAIIAKLNDGFYNNEYGNPTIIIMPMRKDKKQ